MKPTILFIVSYSIAFFVIAVIAANISVKSDSMETIAGVIWGVIVYVAISAIAWIGIIKIADKVPEKYQSLTKFFSGLFVINFLIALFIGSFPLILLFTFNFADKMFRFSAFLQGIYCVSFGIAWVVSLKLE